MARRRSSIDRIRQEMRTVALPETVKFALLASIDDIEPIVFESLEKLCRHIHTERRDGSLVLRDFEAHLRNDPPETKRRLVSVATRLEDGAHGCFVGWAYLDGGDYRALQSTLYALQPNPAAYAEAA